MRWMMPSKSTTARGCNPFWGVLTISTLLSSTAHALCAKDDVSRKDRRDSLFGARLTFSYDAPSGSRFVHVGLALPLARNPRQIFDYPFLEPNVARFIQHSSSHYVISL